MSKKLVWENLLQKKQKIIVFLLVIASEIFKVENYRTVLFSHENPCMCDICKNWQW